MAVSPNPITANRLIQPTPTDSNRLQPPRLYTNGTWSYFCTIITTTIFTLVPFMSLVFGLHPVSFSMEFALAASIYLPITFLLMNYVRRPAHLKGQWMASVSNHVLCFTYFKAVVNTLLCVAFCVLGGGGGGWVVGSAGIVCVVRTRVGAT
jgi:hypothetical protein